MNNIRLGDVLIDFGYITRDQLQAALAYQKEHKNLRVGQALQELGYVNEHQVLEALAQRLHLRVIDFTQINADISAVEKVPRELAQKYDMLPIAINGRIYNPGEEFWYNATVGQRTEARGFQPAAAYSGGKTVTSIGGGICQVSSTLYYSALMADLQIVLRYAHMFDPGYMPVTGCDATVSWGGPDFAFRNSTNYPIKITTSYNDETNQLTITLLGTKTDDHYVEMTNQFLSYSERKTVYQESERIAPGTTEVEQYGHNGYAVQTYRNVYAGDGTLLRSTKEAYSDYDRADKIILVAPGELPQ